MNENELKNMELFTPVITLDTDKITEKIREHEHECWAAEKEIEFVPIKAKEDWEKFCSAKLDCGNKGIDDYFQAYGEAWGKKYHKNRIALTFLMHRGWVSKNMVAVVDMMKSVFKREGLSKNKLEKAYELVSWTVVMYLVLQRLPNTSNAWLPLIDVLKMDAVAVPTKEKWLVFYRPIVVA
jgi:hypothetical protein